MGRDHVVWSDASFSLPNTQVNDFKKGGGRVAEALTHCRHAYLLGIGGIGMGGLAQVLLQRGVRVSGSDLLDNQVTRHLRDCGAHIDIGHGACDLTGVDIVVCSSAIATDNPIVQMGRAQGVPILRRAEMLAWLIKAKRTIAIAGTHGKTTTTGLVVSMLCAADLAPSFFVGGHMHAVDVLAREGSGDYAVVEADESDASFLCLAPEIAVVTNINPDHLENFSGGFPEVKRAFVAFLAKVPAHGVVIACCDNEGVRSILADICAPIVTYGFSEQSDVRIVDYVQRGLVSHIQICTSAGEPPVSLVVNLPGQHNALNALAAWIIAQHLGVGQHACAALANFSGVARRLQVHGDFPLMSGASALLLEDYGHHPSELAVTLAAVRSAWPARRVVWLFQPHRYSRTKTMMDDFVQVLSKVDVLVLLPVYAAGEAILSGADSETLLQRVCALRGGGSTQDCHLSSDTSALHALLPDILHDGDILLVQGAGDVGLLALSLAKSCVVDTYETS